MINIESITDLLSSSTKTAEEGFEILRSADKYYEFVFSSQRNNSMGESFLSETEKCLFELNELSARYGFRTVYEQGILKDDLKTYFFERARELHKDSCKTINSNSVYAMMQHDDYVGDVMFALQSLYNYVQCVAEFEQKRLLIRTQFEEIDADNYRKEEESVDRARTVKHDAAIGFLSMLNRVAKMMNLEPVYLGEVEAENRKNIAASIYEFAKETYNDEFECV